MDHFLTNKKHHFFHSLISIFKPVTLFILSATLVTGIFLHFTNVGAGGPVQNRLKTLGDYFEPLFSETLDVYRIVGTKTENLAAFALGGLVQVHEGLSH
jgi:hypothetical protein